MQLEALKAATDSMVNRDLLNASQAEAKNLRYVCNFSFCIYYIYMHMYVCMYGK